MINHLNNLLEMLIKAKRQSQSENEYTKWSHGQGPKATQKRKTGGECHDAIPCMLHGSLRSMVS